MIKLGHAVYDENGKSAGGKKGDQTGKEVTVWDYYISGGKKWDYVIRIRDENKRDLFARKILAACKNDKIGYDQWVRTSLYNEAKKNNYNIGKISNYCSCDCSSLVACCAIGVGINVPYNAYTGNLKEAFDKTNMVDIFVDTDHLTKPDHLMKGDILLRVGYHVAAVVSV